MGAVAGPAGGLRKVVAGESRICSIDGERGLLAYAGIDIHALAEQSGFEEVVFLLHEGRLPTRPELLGLRAELAAVRSVPAPVVALVRDLPGGTP
jgi:citrate synthase